MRDADRPATDPFGEVQPGFRAYQEPVPDWSLPIISGLLLLALALGIRSLWTGARARQLERQRRRLLNDVGVLQRALVPEVAERLGDLTISAAYRPAEGPGAGGDFYDVFQLRGGRVSVILGDVAGHGRDAIERAALMRYTIRAYVQAGLDPRGALKLTGSVLGEDDEQRFATVAVGVFDVAAGLLTYSLAGHPAPLLLGPGIREPVTVCSSPPLGLGLPTGLRQTTVSLAGDTVACFFTDGLIEARVGDSMFGRENLERLLVTLDPDEDAAALLRQPVEQAADDRAVCLVRSSGRPERPPLHVEELELDQDFLGAEQVEEFLKACAVAPEEIRSAVAALEAVATEPAVVIRVRLGERGGSVEVRAPDPMPRRIAPVLRAPPVRSLPER